MSLSCNSRQKKVSRNLHSKTEQHKSCQPDALLRQQQRRRKNVRRKVRKDNQALPERAQDIDVTVKEGAAVDVAADMGQASTSDTA